MTETPPNCYGDFCRHRTGECERRVMEFRLEAQSDIAWFRRQGERNRINARRRKQDAFKRAQRET